MSTYNKEGFDWFRSSNTNKTLSLTLVKCFSYPVNRMWRLFCFLTDVPRTLSSKDSRVMYIQIFHCFYALLRDIWKAKFRTRVTLNTVSRSAGIKKHSTHLSNHPQCVLVRQLTGRIVLEPAVKHLKTQKGERINTGHCIRC